MNTGSWNIDVQVGKYPQKVASALSNLNETLIGASYEPIAYLGSQVVNGVNHAVLAKQGVLNGKDSENIVVLVFNEKPNDMNVVLTRIESVIEETSPLGGINVDVQTELSDELVDVFRAGLEGFVGIKFEPYALLGTQVTTGVNYFFAAVATPVVNDPNPQKSAVLVIVNPMMKTFSRVDMLTNKHQASLNYAFTW